MAKLSPSFRKGARASILLTSSNQPSLAITMGGLHLMVIVTVAVRMGAMGRVITVINYAAASGDKQGRVY